MVGKLKYNTYINYEASLLLYFVGLAKGYEGVIINLVVHETIFVIIV